MEQLSLRLCLLSVAIHRQCDDDELVIRARGLIKDYGSSHGQGWVGKLPTAILGSGAEPSSGVSGAKPRQEIFEILHLFWAISIEDSRDQPEQAV